MKKLVLYKKISESKPTDNKETIVRLIKIESDLNKLLPNFKAVIEDT